MSLPKKMKFALLAGSVLAAGIAGFVYARYDSLFVFPKKREFVTANLKDPASTQFRNEKSVGEWVCGELNSKNGHGAYVGFKRYMARDEHNAYLDGEGFMGKRDGVTGVLRDTDVVIVALDLRTERLKQRNAQRAAGETPLLREMSESESMDLAQAAIFNKKWDEVCT